MSVDSSKMVPKILVTFFMLFAYLACYISHMWSLPDSFQVEKSAVPIHPEEENDAKIMMDNNNYGALQNEPEAGKRPQQQRFDILEPSYQRQSQCCHSNTDGFKVIVISMFVFAVGVTVALIITIASGKSRVLKKITQKVAFNEFYNITSEAS